MSETPPAVPAPGRGLYVGLALGVPVIAYGVGGVLTDATQTHPVELVRWVIGAAVVHDLLVVPGTLAAAAVLRRVAPRRWRPAVWWALVTSAILTAFSFPLLRGYGRNAAIPSLLNRNYAAGLGAYLAGVWAVAGLVIAARRKTGRSR